MSRWSVHHANEDENSEAGAGQLPHDHATDCLTKVVVPDPSWHARSEQCQRVGHSKVRFGQRQMARSGVASRSSWSRGGADAQFDGVPTAKGEAADPWMRRLVLYPHRLQRGLSRVADPSERSGYSKMLSVLMATTNS